MLFWQSELIWRFMAAVILSGLIGLERRVHGRAAGIRTHMLVGIGAAMLTMLPEMTAMIHGETSRTWMDTGRLVAGLVTGIGFLGAGAIVKMGDMVRGLTTAAGLWFTAALGAVVGSGFWRMATWATVLSLVILIVVDRLEDRLSAVIYRELKVTIRPGQRDALMGRAQVLFKTWGIKLQEVYLDWDRTQDTVEVVFQLRAKSHVDGPALLDDLGQIPDVLRMIWTR